MSLIIINIYLIIHFPSCHLYLQKSESKVLHSELVQNIHSPSLASSRRIPKNEADPAYQYGAPNPIMFKRNAKTAKTTATLVTVGASPNPML